MIASLEGKINFRGEKYIILLAGQIGFKIFLAPREIRNLPSADSTIKLYTYYYQREERVELYGFLNMAELEFFEALTSISGIGPKSGLNIINSASVDTLKKAIASGEIKYLTDLSGVGKKTSQKIILELRSKIGESFLPQEELEENRKVLEALKALGYGLEESKEVLEKIPKTEKGIKQKIKEALRILSKKTAG